MRIKIEDYLKLPIDYSMDEGISQSLLSNSICPVAMLLSLQRWQDPEGMSKYLFGTFGHEVLDFIYTYYHNFKKRPSHRIVCSFISIYISKHRAEYRQFIREETLIEYMIMMKMLTRYYLIYYADDFKYKEFIKTEEVFDVTVDGFRRKGKTDGWFKIKNCNQLMEHKFYSRIEEKKFLVYLNLAMQNLFYMDSHNANHPDEKADQLLYNIVRKPKRCLKSQTIEEYEKWLDEDIQTRPEFYFYRWEIPFTDKDLRNARAIVNERLRFVDRLLKGEERVVKNTLVCYNNGFACEYLKACSSNSLNGYKQKESLFTELG